MIESQRYDVIIIGSGAGGATLAHRLAATGKRILILERGDWLPREIENWQSSEVFGKKRYFTRETWRDQHGKTLEPSTLYVVGGNTKIYGAALMRLRECDFNAYSLADGVSPAWPLSYTDFAPYYRQAETLYQVHGQRGADPAEPPESEPYPYPALSHEPFIAKLAADLAAAGSKPYPLPMGLRVDESHPETSACIRCATCDGFPCLLHAKSDAEIAALRPALAHPNVELLRGAYVERLETSADGQRITGVRVRRNGDVLTLAADIVVSSCGAINSAALLLRSRNPLHPEGLANGSGQLGRNYMCHNNSAFIAFTAAQNPTRFQKTLGLNDYYHARDGRPALGHIQMLGKTDGGVLAANLPPFVPTALLDRMAHHAIDFWLMSEDLPKPENRVQVDADGTIRLSYTPNNTAAHAELDQTLRALLRKARGHESWLPQAFFSSRIPVSGVSHQAGTARFGRDPATSVLDVNCRAHEIDNLYVVDNAFVPSVGAMNPTLTIIANALRVGDVIAERLRG